MVSFCWKMNVLPNKIKNNSVSSAMFMKLTIKVVAFFLGHPVYSVLLTNHPSKTNVCLSQKGVNCSEIARGLHKSQKLLASQAQTKATETE